MDIFVVLPHIGGSMGQAALPACPRGCGVAVTSVPPLSSSWQGETCPLVPPQAAGLCLAQPGEQVPCLGQGGRDRRGGGGG